MDCAPPPFTAIATPTLSKSSGLSMAFASYASLGYAPILTAIARLASVLFASSWFGINCSTSPIPLAEFGTFSQTYGITGYTDNAFIFISPVPGNVP